MTIVDSPGLIDLLPSKTAQQTIDNDVYQWFIDRSDVIYIVIDVSQLHLSSSLRVLLDQLKGKLASDRSALIALPNGLIPFRPSPVTFRSHSQDER